MPVPGEAYLGEGARKEVQQQETEVADHVHDDLRLSESLRRINFQKFASASLLPA